MHPTGPSIYDHPLYYDILVGWDRDAEASFYDAALRLHGARHGGGIIEVGCGTGQIALRLAFLGWDVTGLDLRRPMLDFLEDAARERGLGVRTHCADMTGFTLPHPQDGAVCPVATFSILQDDASAVSHLRATGAALEPGGVYILDLTFVGEGGNGGVEIEEWSMRRGEVEVRATESEIQVEDAERGVSLTLGWGCRMRRYTGEQFEALVAASGTFEVAAYYPESYRDEDGVSVFDPHQSQASPPTGRTMVALLRDG